MSVPERVPEEVLIELDRKERAIEEARKRAEELVAYSAPKVLRTLIDSLDSADAQVQLRAADILLSRLLPKVAAKHIEDTSDIIDSADVASLRESIAAEIQRIKNGEQ